MTSDDDTTRKLRDGLPADEEERTRRFTFEDDENQARYDDEPEPTHLITFDDDQRLYGEDNEPTHLIELAEEPPGSEDEPEPTHLITFDDSAPDDPSHPELPGIQRDVAAVFDFDDPTPHPGLEEGLELELELDESALRQGIRVSKEPEALDDQSTLRRITAVVRERAPSRIVETLQSPGRALLIAFATASVVVFVGFFAVYAALAHAHLDRQLDEVERAIGADLYSSHLAALSDLRRIPDHRVLPVGPVDRTVGAIVDRLPVVSPREKRLRAAHMERYVEARLDYRFVAPATYLDADVVLTIDDSELLAAADVYRRLARGDQQGAVDVAERSFGSGADDDLAILAYSDALAEAGSPEARRLIADSVPRESAAQAFSTARILYVLGRRDDAIDLLRVLSEGDSAHIGARVKLALLTGDADEASDLASTIDDPNHPHASSREQARARVAAARTEDDPATRRDHLVRAANLAPDFPAAVVPLLDFHLERGDLLEARRLHARLPSSPFPTPDFDVAAARQDLLELNLDRAAERLQPHAFDHLEATAMLGVVRLQQSELSEARALFDAVAEHDPGLADALYAWLYAHLGSFDEALEILESLDDIAPPPFFEAIVVEAYRLGAGLAPNRSQADELLDDAMRLGDGFADTPEQRRQACLVSLDRRNSQGADEFCASVVATDLAIRHGLDAMVRYHQYEDGEQTARDVLERHVAGSGSHPAVDILGAQLHIETGELREARDALDAAASRFHDRPEYRIAEGQLASARGRLERAHHHFRRAEETSSRFEPQARLGRIHTAVLLRDASDDTDLESLEELVDDLQPLLRHGELGPRAWTTFAALRRQQERLADASENLSIASGNRRNYGPTIERVELLLEQATLNAHRHGPGDRRLRAQLDALAELDAAGWRYHLLAARWHHEQRRPDTSSINSYLNAALRIAPANCSLWYAVDDMSASVNTSADRPDEC